MNQADHGERGGAAAPRLGWVVLALAFAGIVWFWPAFGLGFRSDDYALVQFVERMTGSVRWDQVTSHAQGPWFQAPYYRPAASLSLALDLWSGLAPSWPHVTNVLLVLLVALAVAWLTLSVSGGREAALIAGLVVIVHPASVEPALWISGRVSSLCVVSTLAACILLCARRGPMGGGLLAAVCTALAVASYEAGVMVPVWGAAVLAMRGESPAGAPRAGRWLAVRWRCLVPAVLVVGCYLCLRQAALGTVVDARVEPALADWIANLAGRVVHLVLAPPQAAWSSLLAAGSMVVLLCVVGRSAPRVVCVCVAAGVLAMAPTSVLPQSAGVLYGRWVFLAVPALAIACGRAVAVGGRSRRWARMAAASLLVGLGATARGEIARFQVEDAQVQRAAGAVREMAGAAPRQPFGIAGLPSLPSLHVGMHGLLGVRPFVERDMALVGLGDLFDRDAPGSLLLGEGAPVHALAAAGGAAYFDVVTGRLTPMPAPAGAEVVLQPVAGMSGVFAAPAGTSARAFVRLVIASAAPVRAATVRFIDEAPVPLPALATRRLQVPATVIEVDLTHALLPLVAAVFHSFHGRVHVELDGAAAPATTSVRALATLPERAVASAIGGATRTPARWARDVARQLTNERAQIFVMTPLGIRTVVATTATDFAAATALLEYLQRSVTLLGAHQVHWFWQSLSSPDGALWRTPFDWCVMQ